MNKSLLFVLENANGLTFVLGAGWCYLGLLEVSVPLAHIVAGVGLMAIGVVPYVRRKRQR